MTTPKPSTSSSSSTSEKGWNYDVFMSFRGEDTRKTFSSHLYEALDGKGIPTFKDDKKLEIGEKISVELVKAIEESKISIVVLSEEYASSHWCLQELVKILECKETKGQKVVPIFYEVDPSDVRNQRGSFDRALAIHEKEGRNVQRWKEALTEVAGLSGHDSSKFGSEAELIKHIVGFISRNLNWDHTPLFVAEHPVGIDSRVEEVISLLGVGGMSNDVRIICIWGVGGIGKTTIAKSVYNKIARHFEGAIFLANVRERSTTHDGLLVLQRTLLSEILRDSTLININNIDIRLRVIQKRLCNKRVLVILDDVARGKQLQKLLGDPNWFGSGSRIIITTRDEGLLKARYGSNYKTYHVEIFNYDEALELFSWYAFKENHPKSGFLKLSKKVVHYTGCLPFALEILGSLLRERSTDEWISEIDKLRIIPNSDIQEILKVSFDGLDRKQKEIFLDLAFFFKWGDINYTRKILESCYGYDPAIDLQVLIDRSLITKGSYDGFEMHDLVREMACEIFRQESPEEPGKRSRLCAFKDVHHVLTKNTGTEAVKGMRVHFSKPKKVLFGIKAFERMNALKLLQVTSAVMPNKIHINYLPNELRSLRWFRYPSTSLPSSFHPTHLVELDLFGSRIEQLWKTKTSTLENLKLLNLIGSKYLTKTPDLSAFPRLEELNLEWCTALVEVHPSSLVLNRLVCLNLSYCISLRRLWEVIELISLKTLNLSGCSKLENLPEIRGTMEYLREVYLNGSGIKELPSSIEHLTGLHCLNLANCENLASLPSSIDKLISLKTLNLSGCSKLENLPEIRGTMEYLREVYLNGSGIKELPSSIEHLTGLHCLNLANCENLASLPSSIDKLVSLKTLNLSGCSKLENLPEIRGTMEYLREVYLNGSGIKELPSSIEHLTGLHCLNLANCENLASLPSSIDKLISLKTLNVSGCSKLESTTLQGCKDSRSLSLLLPSLSGLSSLTELNVSGCNLSDGAIPGISCLSLLRKLNLSRNNFESPPEGLNQLRRLKFIKFENCPRLRELPLLPTSIEEINAHGCRSLEKLRHPSNLENLHNPRVIFSDCQKLNTVIYLQRMHQVPCKGFEFFFSGSETPEWFKHKSTGSSISFDMSPLEFSKFRGVGLCAVLPLMEMPLYIKIRCSLSGKYGSHFWIPPERYTESDHVWLKFLKREELEKYEVSQVSSDGLYHFEASFDIDSGDGDSHLSALIKKCGVHIFNWEEEEIKHNIMFDDSDSDSEYNNDEYDNYSEEYEYDNYSEEDEEEEEEERSGSECSECYSSSGEEEIKHDSGEEEIKYDSDFSSPYYPSGEGEEEEEEDRSGSEWSNKWLSLLKFFCSCFNFDKESYRASLTHRLGPCVIFPYNPKNPTACD